MTDKHTKGPWWLHDQLDEIWHGDSDEMLENTFITEVNGEGSLEQDRANARLIAAAPEMLEALEKAEEWLKGWGSAEYELEIIQAAIAKAKGLDG